MFGGEFGEKRGIFNKHCIKHLASGCQLRNTDMHGDEGVLDTKVNIKVASEESLVIGSHGEGGSGSARLEESGGGER